MKIISNMPVALMNPTRVGLGDGAVERAEPKTHLEVIPRVAVTYGLHPLLPAEAPRRNLADTPVGNSASANHLSGLAGANTRGTGAAQANLALVGSSSGSIPPAVALRIARSETPRQFSVFALLAIC